MLKAAVSSTGHLERIIPHHQDLLWRSVLAILADSVSLILSRFEQPWTP